MLLVALLACIMKSPRIIISLSSPFHHTLCRRLTPVASARGRHKTGPARAVGTSTLPRPYHQAGAPTKTHRKIVVKRIRPRSQGTDLGISRLEMNVQEQRRERKRDIRPPTSQIHLSKIVIEITGGRGGVRRAAQSHRLSTKNQN